MDAKRKDFWQMLIHHIVTLVLIAFSYQFGYLRVGVLVFFTMDICDVFLEGARSGNYLGWDLASNISFVLLLLSWVSLRLVVFPLKIMYSAFFESVVVHESEGYVNWSRPVFYTFNVSLLILLILQFYWFALLIRVLVRILKDGKLTDVTDKDQLKALNAKLAAAKQQQQQHQQKQASPSNKKKEN
jgi:hypothetical protein